MQAICQRLGRPSVTARPAARTKPTAVAGAVAAAHSSTPTAACGSGRAAAPPPPSSSGSPSSSSSAAVAAAAAAPSAAAAGLPARPRRRGAVVARADERGAKGADLASRFNPIYLAIFGVYAGLLVLRNPYIYAALTVLTVLPQNSNVTSLNNLVLLFYESGLFQNFAEAVTCVRLVTWLSMAFMVISFSLTYA